MNHAITFLYSSIYFYSFAAILVAFFWDYTRVPKWLFLLFVFLSRFLVMKNEWLYDLFPNINLPYGFFYALLCLLMSLLLLFLLIRVSFTMIYFAVFTTTSYGFFLKGMEVWLLKPTSDWNLSNKEALIACILYIALSTLLCCVIRMSIVPLFRICQNKWIWMKLSLPAFIDTFAFWLLLSNLQQLQSVSSTFYIGTILFYVTLLVSNIAGCSNIITTMKASQYKAEAENAESIMELQKEHYLKLSHSIEETRIARHDIRHHLAAIQNLAENGDTAALKKYLSQYETTIPEAVIFTGRPSVDAILAHSLTRAKDANVDVIYKNLKFPEVCNIKDTDLTIIFGNCIENAIEASLSVPENKRYIKIGSVIQGNCLMLIFENPYADEIIKNGEQILSSKRNKKAPGIGLTSLKHIAKSYNGSVEINYDGHVFSLMVYLQME